MRNNRPIMPRLTGGGSLTSSSKSLHTSRGSKSLKLVGVYLLNDEELQISVEVSPDYIHICTEIYTVHAVVIVPRHPSLALIPRNSQSTSSVTQARSQDRFWGGAGLSKCGPFKPKSGLFEPHPP